MNRLTRRSLALWGSEQLVGGASVKDLSKSLAACLVDMGKNDEADMLIDDIAWELQKRKLLCRATVTSAHPLSPKLQAELFRQLKKLTGAKEVSFNNDIDSRVLGGLRIETSDTGWDFTLSNKLKVLREAFK